MQQNSDKKLRLSEGNSNVEIMLKSHTQTLEIVLKHKDEQQEYWGSFALKDFDNKTQTLFEKVDKLYEFLC